MADTRRPRLRFFVLIALAVALPAKSVAASTPALIDSVRVAAALCRDYLLEHSHENGSFDYLVQIGTSTRVSDEYNILRHAGTVYSMAMLHRLEPDDRLRDAIRDACSHFEREFIAPVPGHEDMAAAWTKHRVLEGTRWWRAKIGAAGLGLVALTSLERIRPGSTSLRTLRELGRFLLHMQKEDGSFYSLYYWEYGRSDDLPSVFNPGEAALGLVMLHERDPSGPWLEAATRALCFLAERREGLEDVEVDHWALLATERRLAQHDEALSPADRNRLIHHSARICETILKDHRIALLRAGAQKSLTGDGSTTPTATRLEGLIATWFILPAEHPLRKPIEAASVDGIRFLLDSQVKDGAFAGAIPGEVPDRRGSRKRRATEEVRIDYVQHALSAMVEFIEMHR